MSERTLAPARGVALGLFSFGRLLGGVASRHAATVSSIAVGSQVAIYNNSRIMLGPRRYFVLRKTRNGV
jgi:hypothetical protein